MGLAVVRRDFGRLRLSVDRRAPEIAMEITVIVHPAEEGGYWAEIPSIPGCATEGDTVEELLENLVEAIDGCLD